MFDESLWCKGWNSIYKKYINGLGNCAKSFLINVVHLTITWLTALDHSQQKKVSIETNFSVYATSPDSGFITAC